MPGEMRNGYGHPNFDFTCEECGVVFEETYPLEDNNNGHVVLCPDCGGLSQKGQGFFCKHVSWSTWQVSEGNRD